MGFSVTQGQILGGTVNKVFLFHTTVLMTMQVGLPWSSGYLSLPPAYQVAVGLGNRSEMPLLTHS